MPSSFLPFTPKGKDTELRAIEVKARLLVAVADAVDPFLVLERIPARIVDSHEFRRFAPPELSQSLFVDEREDWSGVGLGESPVDGVSLILLNDSHAPTRQRATLMEEIVHIVLDHPKSTLTVGANGVSLVRSHDAGIEDEAYCVGAACMLPYPALFHAIRDAHEGAASIARRYGLSVQHVDFRIRRAGLSNMYRKHCQPQSL